MAPYVWGQPPAGAKIPSYSEKWDPSDKGKRPTCIAKFCFQYIETRYETGKQRFFHRFQCLNDVCKKEFNIIANSGFKNLENHMDTCISVAGTDKRVREAIEELQNSNGTAKQQQQMQTFFHIPSDRDKAIHSIMRWFFVDNDLPISTLDKQSFKSNSIHQQHWPSSPTMRKYLLKLVPIVEKKISNMLPNKFACHFDGWTAHTVHYLAVFAAFLHKGELKELLLSISPLARYSSVDRAALDAAADEIDDDSIESDDEEEDEEEEEIEEASDFTAKRHREHIDRLLMDYYGKNIEENVTNFCGDNCGVNKKLADDTGKGFVGCASHRHTLEMNRFTTEQESLAYVVETAHEIMLELKTLKNASHLRKYTRLTPRPHQKTRWSSKKDMIKRLDNIKQQVKKIDDVKDKLPKNINDKEKFRLALQIFEEQDIICKRLQNGDMKSAELCQTRRLLEKAAKHLVDTCNDDDNTDLLVSDYAIKYLLPTSDIVKSKHFEQGVIKIQKGKEHELTREEKRAVRFLLLEEPDEEDDEGFDDEVASPATKRRKKMDKFLDGDASDSEPEKSKYMDCRFILGTNNTVERCFSRAKRILSDARAGMTPYTFEALLFLKLHSDLWGLREVAAAIREADKAEN